MIIRGAEPKDVAAILDLIIGLAVYENEPDQVENTVDKLTHDLFERKYCEAFVAELDDTIVGFTILDVVAKINLFSLFCTALFTSHVSQLTPLPLGI